MIEIVTPSYGHDFELAKDLVASVKQHVTDADVRHRLIVPRTDLAQFQSIGGVLLSVDSSFMPSFFRRLPRSTLTLNMRAPWPPIRGWIRQQIIKLAAASRSTARVVLCADSDVRFVRDFSSADFDNGAIRLHRRPDTISSTTPEHMLWQSAARDLLGLDTTASSSTNYIAPMVSWNPDLVRAMLRRIEMVKGEAWYTAVGRHLYFSEDILYGVYVEELSESTERAFASTRSLCHTYWPEASLDEDAAVRFISGRSAEDLAVAISAKSSTSVEIRRRAFDRALR